jgi:hypothetical protein
VDARARPLLRAGAADAALVRQARRRAEPREQPPDTVVVPSDFVFRPVGVDALYTEPTISAVFVAQTPIPAAARPPGAAGFVDDSFTRPTPRAPSWLARARAKLA